MQHLLENPPCLATVQPSRRIRTNDLSAALQKVADQKFLIFSIDSDVCFYPEEQAKLVQLLKESGAKTTRLTVHSEKGHDAFLLEPDLFEPYMQSFLNE